ncbi:hypothetical protein [Rhodoferax sp.]|uniref:phage fiber-tail adaptor protein n=1 Tax=Rhodoferax sp. TaxID=50421 RepID=UPI002ACE3E42|nr:hypothetical protein [Rhodoferax sp.]MDZ7920743.1 hypothetical protein [Rhodoferax sp.]
MSNLNSTTWPAKYAQERITAEFDFARDIAPGDAVASVQMVVTTVLGVDATPAALLYGAVQLKGARAFQQLQGGVAGCSYRVEAQATTQNNNLLLLARVLPVVAL